MRNTKYIFITIITCTLLLLVSGYCDSKPHSVHIQDKFQQYYYFYYDFSDNREILKSSPVGLLYGSSTEVVVDSVLKYLSNNYFNKCYYIHDATDINLSLLRIDSVQTKYRVYKIAIINIIDEKKVCIGCFFQGSTGGQITYKMLALNILQPQFAFTTSFLDGVIFLYNGSDLTGLDHIDIDGILVPKIFYMDARKAIK